MKAEPIRCSAPHPANPLRECHAWLVNAVGGSVNVTRSQDPPPGCVEVRCPRCSARYVFCLTGGVARELVGE